MEYLHLARAMDAIESSSSRTGKVSNAAELFSTTPEPLLADVVRLLTGQVTAPWRGEFMGADVHMVSTALCEAGGFSAGQLSRSMSETGELGLTARQLLTHRVQSTLAPAPLDCAEVHEMLRRVAAQQGDGAQRRKADMLRALFTRSEPLEALYLVRTVLGRSLAGLSVNQTEDAIAMAFCVPVEPVRRACALLPDFGNVAVLARDDRLEDVRLELFRPVRPRSMQPMDEVQVKTLDGRLWLSARFGGVYIQVHKNGDEVRVFTRGLWEVGRSLVELAPVFDGIRADSAVVEGELVAGSTASSRNGAGPPPYIDVAHRLGRKHHHDTVMREFPLRFYACDLLFLNGADLTDKRQTRRCRLLKRLARRSGFILPPNVTASSHTGVEEFMAMAESGGARSVAAIDTKAHWGARDGGRYLLRLSHDVAKD